MRRDEVITILSAHADELCARFGVTSLRVFGSVARDDARPSSDVDLLVDFVEPPSFASFMDLRFFLEDLLGVTVDLVTENGLKARVRPYVEKDAIRVA